jgi:hypothetical protein
LGGEAWGGSALFGVQLSPRVAVEIEPSFGGAYSWQYTYRPSPLLTADVVASRRDTFVPVQIRIRFGAVEPVVGLGYVHERIRRHATLVGGRPYFDDSRSDAGAAVVGGLDAALRIGSQFYFVPTFRVFVAARGTDRTGRLAIDPLGADTSTGSVAFRYGAGARVAF